VDGGGGGAARSVTAGVEAAALHGAWQLLRCETPLELEPETRMEFGPDGALTYRIPTAGGQLQVVLRWRLEVGVLHTQLEDGSNPVQVPVSLGEAGVLQFDFGGPRAWFARVV
jgi:hypothetical protein